MQLASLSILCGTACATLPHHHPQHSAPKELLDRIAKSNPSSLRGGEPDHIPAGSPGRAPFEVGARVSPIGLGGDPTGVKDSWEALDAAIGKCLNQSARSPNGFFPGQDTVPQFGPIRDMGGCSVDLEGGEYRISKPLHIPEMNANMQFGHGSLVATPDFEGEFLFVVGTKDETKTEGCRSFPQASCNIDINFPELFLDGAKRTSGMQINNVMGATVGPGGYFLNFTEFGLQINNGHEVMMDRCWLGETNFDFDHEAHGVSPNATAIQINGNDHYILNTIVFSALVGLEVNGAADYITGVHVWFPDNHAVAFADSYAFHITGAGNRFMGCYIDGGRAVFDEAALTRNIWQQGFECCQRGLPAPGTNGSGIYLRGNTVGPGLQIINNEFSGGSIYHVPVSPDAQAVLPLGKDSQKNGNRTSNYEIQGVRIADNSMAHALGTQAELSLTQSHAKVWQYDFCSRLVFPQIATVKFHVTATTGFPVAVARPPQGCTVTIETSEPVTGTIVVEVDSSAPSVSFE